ncbi:hypothetical protein EUX98_g6857 [Antrodiella citrinella]|uniref:Uncharacterized protein n=1 Tax=Antrodiella citrinella TaxID=2447956 RepID=A0A4V3XI09_9APHY|nr:hypothetical protein EUX98_g6857 [Antrodiella citrinella]
MLPDETTYEYPERPTSASSQNQLPTIALNTMQLSHERLADLGFPMPLPSPPAANKKLPQPHLSLPKSSPHASVSKPMNAIETIDLLRPSFLTKPRPAPVAPGARMGASRHGRPDMRGALLTRMATKRSRSHGDPTEEDSPVSIYSQASLRRGDTHKFFPKRGGGVDLEAPPVPPLPRPFPDELTSPVVQTRRNSFSGVPSPTRHMFAEEEDPNASSFTVQHRIFLDTALPSPEASLVSNSRWWSNVWGSYIPSSPTNPSPTQTSTGGIGLPVGRRSLAAHRQSTNPTTKDVPWHAMPQYGVVEQAYGNVSGERGQVMIAAFGEGSQGRVERAARRLPPAPSTSS